MKTIYWQRHNLPRTILIAFCIFVLIGLSAVEYFKKIKLQHHYKAKVMASQLAEQAYLTIKKARLARRINIDKSLDPQYSGLVGMQLTSITTDSSDLGIKRTSVNPNTAALFIQWLKELKVKPGDNVAINMTGSFPALNISMLAAIKTLQLNPLIIYSAGSSQFGANIPYFSWVDMYSILTKAKIFDYPVLGISIGGKRDKGYGMSSNGLGILQRTIAQYNYHLINSTSTIDGINQRMQLYQENSNGKPIVAFINIGGNMSAIGLKRIKNKDNPQPERKVRSIPTGIVDKLPIELVNTDSVAVRFLKDGVPVINAHNMDKTILNKYKFPELPRKPVPVGNGILFYNLEYNTWLAFIVLIIDILVFCLITHYSKKYVIRYKR